MVADVSANLKLGFDGLGTKVDGIDNRVRDFIAAEQNKYRGVKWMRLPLLQGTVSASGIAIGESNGQEVGPEEGYAWSVGRFCVAGLSAGTAATTSTATGTITSGAGSAALASGVPVTGFTLSFSAAPSTTGTATLSNVVGGPYVYNIPSGQTSPYTVNFPAPIAASGAATLTVAGLGTGAGTITLYGQTAAVGADVVDLYRSSNLQQGGFLWEFTGATALRQEGFGKGRMTLFPGDRLQLVSVGTVTAAVGTQITLSGEVTSIPAEMLPKLLT